MLFKRRKRSREKKLLKKQEQAELLILGDLQMLRAKAEEAIAECSNSRDQQRLACACFVQERSSKAISDIVAYGLQLDKPAFTEAETEYILLHFPPDTSGQTGDRKIG